MESWLFFLTLLAEALLIMAVLDLEIEAELPSPLIHILKKLNNNLIHSPGSLAGISTRKLLGIRPKQSNKSNKELLNQTKHNTTGNDGELTKDLKSTQLLGKPIQHYLGSKPNHFRFPPAPVSKGYTCPTHKGSVVNCATFFEHENYEYKLLCRGELYFRLKGTHTFRTGPVAPKEPGSLFIVKLDDTGSNIVTFCFEPSSRALGEVNGNAEFLPVQTSIASSQGAHGLLYTQGQGCVFDWVYGDRSSSQYPWDYNLRYDVGWMHSGPATEELFASNDKVLEECCSLFANSQNPLKHSLEGLDLVRCIPSPDALGDIQVGFAHIELNNPAIQSDGLQSLPSSSSQLTLPYPLLSTSQPEASTSSDTVATSRSVLRRTCTICNRVLRRPSALTIHMNAHLGIKPFQCNECDYSSTNSTNLQRHQQTRHHGGN
ncbi:unnamed protein product [Rhizoctonia solani]|uniref:C2H2-type domain-containing protein n=1 Tax=Rhizoctonia solani TaxID=456999 RepID=A0A8H3DJ00_9AGAM|nr:unnamed protein product [Rhizoctonia solani]